MQHPLNLYCFFCSTTQTSDPSLFPIPYQDHDSGKHPKQVCLKKTEYGCKANVLPEANLGSVFSHNMCNENMGTLKTDTNRYKSNETVLCYLAM